MCWADSRGWVPPRCHFYTTKTNRPTQCVSIHTIIPWGVGVKCRMADQFSSQHKHVHKTLTTSPHVSIIASHLRSTSCTHHPLAPTPFPHPGRIRPTHVHSTRDTSPHLTPRLSPDSLSSVCMSPYTTPSQHSCLPSTHHLSSPWHHTITVSFLPRTHHLSSPWPSTAHLRGGPARGSSDLPL